jgi:hemolysin III
LLRFADIDIDLDGNLVREEVTSSILHGTGLLLSACGAVPLLTTASQSNDKRHFWGVLVYLCTLLCMYASSTLGHSFFMYRRTAHVFRMIDHSAIYVLIAGTYTPFMLVNLRNKFAGNVMLVTIWVLALAAVLVSAFLAGKYRHFRTQLAWLIGWCAVIAYRSISQCIHQVRGDRFSLRG